MTFDGTQIILALLPVRGGGDRCAGAVGEGKDDNGAAGAAWRVGQDCRCPQRNRFSQPEMARKRKSM